MTLTTKDTKMDFDPLSNQVLGAAVDALAPIHEAQVLTYLKLSGLKVGLLINFNMPLLKHGIKRFVL